jgi:hypothetical protein
LVGVDNRSLVTQRFETVGDREAFDPDARAAAAAARAHAEEAQLAEEARSAREQLLQTKEQIFADAVKAAAGSLRGLFETTFGAAPSRPAVLEATDLFRENFASQ